MGLQFRAHLGSRHVTWLTNNVLCLVLIVVGLVTQTAWGAQGGSPQPALRIVVLEGEASVNIVRQKTAVVPLVEVRDRNDQPVAGAVVTFAIRSGRAAFSGSRTLTVTTNAAGRAAATGLTPTGSGAVQIGASAAFQGQTAAVTIAQTNVMTAAEAAAASSAGASGGGAGAGSGASAGAGGGGAGGGGLSGGAIAGIVGGAAAGVGAAVAKGGNDSPLVSAVTPSASAGLLGATSTISFSVQASDANDDPLTTSWDFGDGGTATGTNATHTYASAGTFTVRVTVSDGKTSATGQTVVTIKTLTATWLPVDSTSGSTLSGQTFMLTQAGALITGGYVSTSAPPCLTGGSATISNGAVRTTSPYVTMTFTFTSNCGVTFLPFTYTADPSSDANTLTGVYNGSGYVNAPVTLRRQ